MVMGWDELWDEEQPNAWQGAWWRASVESMVNRQGKQTWWRRLGMEPQEGEMKRGAGPWCCHEISNHIRWHSNQELTCHSHMHIDLTGCNDTCPLGFTAYFCSCRLDWAATCFPIPPIPSPHSHPIHLFPWLCIRIWASKPIRMLMEVDITGNGWVWYHICKNR